MYQVKGTIKDSRTGRPVANANISVTDSTGAYLPVNGNNIGRTSDSTGFFTIPVTPEDGFITISYVGYKPFTLPAASAQKLSTFKMVKDENELPEVQIKTVTPRTRATPSTQTLSSTTAPAAGSKKIWIIAGAIAAVAIISGLIYYLKFRK